MAITLVLLFLFLKQFYFFPSGNIGLADISLILCFLILIRSHIRNRDLPSTLKSDILLYLFLLCVLTINSIYGIINQNK